MNEKESFEEKDSSVILLLAKVWDVMFSLADCDEVCHAMVQSHVLTRNNG